MASVHRHDTVVTWTDESGAPDQQLRHETAHTLVACSARHGQIADAPFAGVMW
jgi:hypothetical protein